MNILGNRHSNERGQSLVLAIIVMFLLVFIGVVFVLLVARNQGRAGGARDRLAAQYLAEAGINYADTMLRTSEKGADWRPAPDNIGFDRLGVVPNANLADIAANHPDFKWLRPYAPVETAVPGVADAMGPTGGFTSFTMGEGRYLLRVTYNPDADDPMSKYIKIEAIGRIGVVDEKDPTTWEGLKRLRRELTAYKPIGLTDYLRFETNKEKRSADIPLGAPGFKVEYGGQKGGETRGAPIRVNGNLAWYGDEITLFLRGKTYPGGIIPIDQVEVAGEIKHQSDDPISVKIYEYMDGTTLNGPFDALPSRDPAGFTTANGFYRDGSGETDADQYARGIKRLEPPIIDSSDTPNKVPRYITLTRDSGVWIDGPNGHVNSGRFGWGRGVYIDNRDDLQPESETLFGGYTPRADWMKPNNDMASYWQGPYYVPPGVVIILNPYDTDGDGQADITLTRTDIKSRFRDPLYGKKAVWFDAVGNPMNSVGSTITIPYPQGQQDITYYDGNASQTITLDRNGVIFAEGNVRVRGMLAPGKQLTVVSGGIIYVEGNLLKYRDRNTSNAAPDPTSAIALLAKEYVCVNTTQFVSLLTATGPASIGSDSGTGEPPYHLVISPEPNRTFYSTFSFGPPTGLWQPGDTPALFVRHAGQYGPSYINMWLNRGLLDIGVPNPLGIPLHVYGCGDPLYCQPGTGLSSLFEHKIWPLDGALLNGASLHTVPGMPNYFEMLLDQSSYTRNNYLLSAFAVQPLDIRIEAIIYAQNRSFFVIPGNWFNMNPTDVPGNSDRPRGVDEMWPFFGQPLDTKITIDGAVTENLPASTSETGEWYSKWGNIPARYGSSSTPTAHPGEGLTFIYDETLGWPVYDKAGKKTPVREDEYGRPLPITPCLPVCESLYYYGEPT